MTHGEVPNVVMSKINIASTPLVKTSIHNHDGIYSPVNHTHEGGANLPTGIILMWSGLRANIPTGWYLCDGANGTPDLRDKFVCSVTGIEEAGITGGSTTLTHAGVGVANHAAQSHAGTAIGDHAAQTHSGTAVGNHAATATSQASAGATQRGTTTSTLTLLAHTHNTPVLTHAVTQPSQHAALAHIITQPSDHPILSHITTQPNDHTNVQPPYYKLCFIMKGA